MSDGCPAAGPRVSLGLALGVGVASTMTVALTGVLIVQIRQEFRVELDAYGLFFLTYSLVAAATSNPAGRFVERVGTRRGALLCLVSCSLALTVGGLSRRSSDLFVALVIAGIAKALGHPAANALLYTGVPASRRGSAFGLKQATIPAALALSGLAVPTLAASFGWRSAYLVTAAAVALFAFALHSSSFRGVSSVVTGQLAHTAGAGARRRFVWLGLGAGLATASASPLGSYVVDWGVESGWEPSSAGLVIAVAAFAGIVTRVMLGRYVDREGTPDPFTIISTQLAIGAMAYVLLAIGAPALFVAGAVIGYMATWGWPGLFHFGVVSASDGMPAVATGLSQIGVTLGSGLGPMLFGWAAVRWSYPSAWIAFGALAMLGSVALAVGGRTVLRSVSTDETVP